LQEEKRFLQRESDTPQRATLKKQATLEPHRL
jgi:hypothetical protein